MHPSVSACTAVELSSDSRKLSWLSRCIGILGAKSTRISNLPPIAWAVIWGPDFFWPKFRIECSVARNRSDELCRLEPQGGRTFSAEEDAQRLWRRLATTSVNNKTLLVAYLWIPGYQINWYSAPDSFVLLAQKWFLPLKLHSVLQNRRGNKVHLRHVPDFGQKSANMFGTLVDVLLHMFQIGNVYASSVLQVGFHRVELVLH